MSFLEKRVLISALLKAQSPDKEYSHMASNCNNQLHITSKSKQRAQLYSLNPTISDKTADFQTNITAAYGQIPLFPKSS
jgi:hypothetical protein